MPTFGKTEEDEHVGAGGGAKIEQGPHNHRTGVGVGRGLLQATTPSREFTSESPGVATRLGS